MNVMKREQNGTYWYGAWYMLPVFYSIKIIIQF